MTDSVKLPPGFQPLLTAGAELTSTAVGWRLSLPPGPAGRYRVAQLDDYQRLPRRRFPWRAGASLSLRARASQTELPGTWGMGWWNDPFGLGLLPGGGLRLPALPNAAWFFFASPPNYLSLRDDLPACGALAATFCSPRWPAFILSGALLGLPLLWVAPLRRGLRRLGRRIIRQEAALLEIDPALWHHYRLEWQAQGVSFYVDEQRVWHTALAPRGPLGVVIWIDNQYAAFPAEGPLRYGTLANPQPAWIEIADLSLND